MRTLKKQIVVDYLLLKNSTPPGFLTRGLEPMEMAKKKAKKKKK